MPILECSKCKKKIDLSVSDFESEFGNKYKECHLCYTIISSERYPKTPGKVTVFSSRGRSMGDYIYSEVILQYYKKMNPDERIVIKDDDPQPGEVRTEFGNELGKYFVSDVRIFHDIKLESSCVIKYKMMNEVIALSKMGYYSKNKIPQVPLKAHLLNKISPQGYVVVAPRNQHIKPERNIDVGMFNEILRLIDNSGLTPVVVGTNPRLRGEIYSANTIELRGQTTVENLSFLLHNAFACVGPDSGPIHLAAVNYCPFVAWNYEEHKKWIPRNLGYGVCFSRRESDKDSIYEAIKKMINWKRNLIKTPVLN